MACWLARGLEVNNNFNLIRLWAALAVIWSHSYPLTSGPGNHDALHWYFGHNLGRIAVDVFFVVSGYLITGSAARSKSLLHFSINRFLRIYPGLWGCLLLTCTVFLAFSGDASGADRLLETARYFLSNATLANAELDYSLGAVFSNVPTSQVVNGSLWTLPWEVRMYALIAICYFVFYRWRRYLIVLMLIAALAADLISHYEAIPLHPLVSLVARFVCTFFMGAFFAEFVPGWRPSAVWIGMFVLGGAFLAMARNPLPYPLYLTAMPVVVFGLALSIPCPAKLRRLVETDMSYGVYLYGFPIQQLIVSAFPGISPTAMTMATIPLALAMGWVSYKFVEAPALAYKPWLLARVRRLPMLGGQA
jgi:peptidoglycan/LPS O-acetylase OafA/YrhL